MSSFPPKQWAVRYLHDMDKMQCTERTEPGIYMETFLAARPAKGQEGTFRFVLYGPEKVKLRFPVNTVLTSGLFAGMVVEVEVDIRDHIRLEKNSVCSKWMDVLELVQSQDMLILDGLGEDASEEFVAAMAGCAPGDGLHGQGRHQPQMAGGHPEGTDGRSSHGPGKKYGNLYHPISCT